MLTDAEIRALIRRYDRCEISSDEMTDILSNHGVTVERIQRVERAYTIQVVMLCMVITGLVWIVTAEVVWLVKG